MLKRFLDPATLTLSRPQSAGELTVPPLLRPGTAEPGYLTLGEALVGAKLFDSPRTFAQLLPKLVRSYGLDALDHSLPRDSAPARWCTRGRWCTCRRL